MSLSKLALKNTTVSNLSTQFGENILSTNQLNYIKGGEVPSIIDWDTKEL